MGRGLICGIWFSAPSRAEEAVNLEKTPLIVYCDLNYAARVTYRSVLASALYADTIYAFYPAWDAIDKSGLTKFEIQQFLALVDSGKIIPSGHDQWWEDSYRVGLGFRSIDDDPSSFETQI